MARVIQGLLASIALPIALSCASILGIEEAQPIKPDTSDDGGDGTGGDNGGGTGGSTGGDNGGGAGGDNGGSDGGPTGPKAICAEYCLTALKNCTGPLELYPTLPYCNSVCQALPPGARGDMGGNTVGCRLHFAEAAALGEKSLNCSAAGPGGNGVCGENCESWCTLEKNICPAVYATAEECLKACRTFPVEGSYNDGDATQTGNKFECRLYHVTAAAGIGPKLHCPHTDIKIEGPPCADPPP